MKIVLETNEIKVAIEEYVKANLKAVTSVNANITQGMEIAVSINDDVSTPTAPVEAPKKRGRKPSVMKEVVVDEPTEAPDPISEEAQAEDEAADAEVETPTAEVTDIMAEMEGKVTPTKEKTAPTKKRMFGQ